MNTIRSYFKFMQNFNRAMRDLKAKFLHEYDDSISHFDYIYEKIDLGLDKKLVDVEFYKIDNPLYRKIIDNLLLLRYKMVYLITYKESYVFYLKSRLVQNELTTARLFTDINLKAKNILESEVLKASGSSTLVKYDWDFKDSFNTNSTNIIPNFTNIKPLEFVQDNISDGRVHLHLSSNNYISKIDLSFNRNLQDEVRVGFKTIKDGDVIFTSDIIKLSKFKQIALRYENCIEIIIYSNSNFAKHLTNINVYGGRDTVNEANCFGILNLGNNSYSDVMIETNNKMDFYKITNRDLKEVDTYFFHSDLENSKLTTRIESNVLVPVEVTEFDKILVRFKTDEPILNNINIYCKIKEVI